MSENEIIAAGEIQLDEFNAQLQTKLVHDPSFAVARSYVDQAERAGTLSGKALKRGAQAHRPGREARRPAQQPADRSLRSSTMPPASRGQRPIPVLVQALNALADTF